MKLYLGGVVALVGAAYGAIVMPNGEVSHFDEAAVRSRSLATTRELASMGTLCSTTAQSKAELIVPHCENEYQTLGLVDWNPCCAFGTDSSSLCREFATSGEYCDVTTDSKQCALTTGGHKLYIYLDFETQAADQQCCYSCTCYGDPECISFNNVADLWIPCDARRSTDCKIAKDICVGMKDPNNQDCQWLRTDSDVSGGSSWNIATQGSPCVPDLSKDIMMNMYTSANKQFSLDLYLGERGIIAKTKFKIGSKTYTLDANECFDKMDATAWTGFTTLPAGWSYEVSPDGKEVKWLIFDSATNVRVEMACIRAIESGEVGSPRINVQDLSALTNTGSGFCASNTIAKSGYTADSEFLHAECVQNQTDALQACKHLIGMGLGANQLEWCGNQFCTLAAVSNKDKCKNEMGAGDVTSKWKKWYCDALNGMGLGLNSKKCQNLVQGNGWPWAVETWGNGIPDNTQAQGECMTKITDYVDNGDATCVDGVHLEIYNKATKVWEPAYFFPVTNPPCNGKLEVTPAQAKELFTNSIRMRQCDVRSQPNCGSTRSCGSTPGATFKLVYTNTARELLKAYEENMLCCSKDQNGSTSWCLPGSSDYKPLAEVCPCPDNSRRLLDIFESKTTKH